MIAEISAGLGSLKAAKDIVQALNGMQTAASVNDVKLTLQSHILEAQQGLFAAQEAQSAAAKRISDLEREIAILKDWTIEKLRYQLLDLHRGAVAYAPKPGMENGEPPHWLCTTCFNQGRKSFLQFKGQDKRPNGGNGDESTYACDTCKGSIKVRYNVTPSRLKEMPNVAVEPEPTGPVRPTMASRPRIVTRRPR